MAFPTVIAGRGEADIPRCCPSCVPTTQVSVVLGSCLVTVGRYASRSYVRNPGGSKEREESFLTVPYTPPNSTVAPRSCATKQHQELCSSRTETASIRRASSRRARWPSGRPARVAGLTAVLLQRGGLGRSALHPSAVAAKRLVGDLGAWRRSILTMIWRAFSA